MAQALSKAEVSAFKSLQRLLAQGMTLEEIERTYRLLPITLKEFVEDEYYLGSKDILFPKVMNCLEELNEGNYDEAVLTGAIGTGKTTIGLFTTAYQLYLLSILKEPHRVFDLDPSSEIVFIFQSINEKLAKSVDYDRFKAMIEKSPYFTENFPFDKDILSELRFPRRIIVKPVSGAETGAIGQNVFGGIIDELNFMAVVENSKVSMDGGTYDQAKALYNSISRRRKSRFMKAGRLPGILCLVSSKRYPGQFTDQKEEEARRELSLYGKTSIYIYDKRTWEIKPEGSFSGQWFNLFIGDAYKKPRIMKEGETVSVAEEHLVMKIPEEYRMEFETDIMNALRDIAGVSTLATHPFIPNTEKISLCFTGVQNILTKVKSTLTESDKISARSVKVEKKYPRFAHLDLALTGDSVGFVIGHVPKFDTLLRGGDVEILPHIVIDCVLEVPAPPGGEILYHRLREVIYSLRDKIGLPIRWVTLDSYQSVDMQQILRQKGFVTGTQSMDVTTVPYDILKSAIYDGRLEVPECEKLQKELASLEKDVKKNKIDHPPHSSKDIADALAGVVYGLTMRREIWAMHGIPVLKIPQWVKETKMKEKEAA